MRYQVLAGRRRFNKRVTATLLSSVWVVCGALAAYAADPAENDRELLKAKPEVVEAWQDMRFGMFICWGPVSLTGKEIGWSRGRGTPVKEYDNLYKRWNPQQFDARAWAKVVRETGAKYVVFLTKHHDGFCLWDTKQTDYNVMNTPFGRDVTGELAAALKDEGIAFFPYYSTCDWHHPDFPLTSPGGKTKRATHNLERYTAYLEAQSKELITQYGPLLGIWYDVPQCFDRARGERVIRYVRRLQPDLLVNNRTGAPGDFDTPEQRLGKFPMDRPWETCMTLGTQWAWKPNDHIKSLKQCIDVLVTCAARNGNLALNTGPMPDGRIEPRQAKRFRKIGGWLDKYGESIYGTRGGPYVSPGWGGSTRKGHTLYIHILKWPQETLVLPPIDRKIVSHSALTGGTSRVEQTDDGITVDVPPEHRNELDTIVRLELDASAMPIKPIRILSPELRGVISLEKKASASGQWSGRYDPSKAFDGERSTRWGAPPNSTTGWLAVDLGKPMTFNRVVILEAWNRVRRFRLQYKNGVHWKTFHAGTTLGPFDKGIQPVHARHVRLMIQEAADVPTIWEFRLYASEAEK